MAERLRIINNVEIVEAAKRERAYRNYRELARKAWGILKDGGLTRKRSDGMNCVELGDRLYPHERWRVGIEIENGHKSIRMVQIFWSQVLVQSIGGRELVFDWGWEAADRKAQGDISDCEWAVADEAIHQHLMDFLDRALILDLSMA